MLVSIRLIPFSLVVCETGFGSAATGFGSNNSTSSGLFGSANNATGTSTGFGSGGKWMISKSYQIFFRVFMVSLRRQVCVYNLGSIDDQMFKGDCCI